LSDAAKKDVKRIDEIWANFAKKDEDGKIFLFGKFSIADCFFAPVVFRFMTYGIELSEASRAYMKSMLELESMKKWLSKAVLETEVIPEDEAGAE
jgi:glutathione S-transferase